MWRLPILVVLCGCGGAVAPALDAALVTPSVDQASAPADLSSSIDAGANDAALSCSSYIAVPGVAGCQFYSCLEAEHPCGPSGYYLGFGEKYCVRFLTDVYPELSPAGQAFLTAGRDCLMHAVEAIGPESCDDLRRDALDSHVACYRDNGFCALSLSDKLTLFFAVDSADRDFTSMLQTELACF